jgi:hypothetical protein
MINKIVIYNRTRKYYSLWTGNMNQPAHKKRHAIPPKALQTGVIKKHGYRGLIRMLHSPVKARTKLSIFGEPAAESYNAIGASARFTSSTPLTAGISSLVGLQYVFTAMACGIIFTLLGSLLFYETLRFAAMLLSIAL